MKKKLFVGLCALVLGVVSTSSLALANEKSKLLAKGMVKLSDAQVAKIKSGKTIKGVTVPKGVKWTNQYKANGIKIATFKGKSHKRKWSYKGGEWCETSGKKMNCEIAHFKLGNQCYIFKDNGSVAHRFGC